jgi:hypothetical protein
MVDFGSGQGRSDFARRRRSPSTPRIAKSENAGMGRKMPFMDGHSLPEPPQAAIHLKGLGPGVLPGA